MKKLIKRYLPGGITEKTDATRVKTPRTDVLPVYYEPAVIAERAASKLPQSGAVTPVHPEFELALGTYGILGDAIDLFKLGKLGVKKLRNKVIKPLGARVFREALTETPLFRFYDDPYTLPDYAVPNSQTPGMALVNKRLETGGKKRLKITSSRYTEPEEVLVHYFTPPLLYYDYDLLTDEAVSNIGLNFLDPDYKQQHDFYMKAFYDNPGGFAVAEHKQAYVPNTLSKNIIEPHEVDHLVHYPGEPPLGIDVSIWPEGFLEYMTIKNGTEVSARGTLLKNYFGLTDDSLEFTEDMLRYAAEHYIEDTGVDNDMSEFFASITDYKKLAEWINKHSMVSAGVVGGAALSGNNERRKKDGLISKHAKGNKVEETFGIDTSKFTKNPSSTRLDSKKVTNPNEQRNKLTKKKHASYINPLFVNTRPTSGFITFPIKKIIEFEYKNS